MPNNQYIFAAYGTCWNQPQVFRNFFSLLYSVVTIIIIFVQLDRRTDKRTNECTDRQKLLQQQQQPKLIFSFWIALHQTGNKFILFSGFQAKIVIEQLKLNIQTMKNDNGVLVFNMAFFPASFCCCCFCLISY